VETDSPIDDAARDRGFTLVELLIVVVVMGTLMAVLTTAVIVALRTTPDTETRVDDARGVQGLVTWLPQDVDAAAPDGFDRATTAWPCAAPAPTDSHNVLTIRWTETAATTTNYAASYRYERKGSAWTMARYYCVAGGSATRNNLTNDLAKPWDNTFPPAWTTMCSEVVDDSGNCPIPIIASAITAPPEVRSLKLILELEDGRQVMIDAAPKNPDQTLAGDPDATANQPPTLSDTEITLELYAGETKAFVLSPTYFTATDPDGDSTAITVSVDHVVPLPDILESATMAFQYELTLVAGPDAGESVDPLMLIVSDERAGWRAVEATIVVLDPPNEAPTSTSTPLTLGLPANIGTLTLDPISLFDIDDDAPLTELTTEVTAAVPGTPPVDPTMFSVAAAPPSGVAVSFGAGIATQVGGLIEVDLIVRDAEAAELVLHLTIEILPSSSNHVPTAGVPNLDRSVQAGASIDVDVIADHAITDSDVGDVLTAEVLSAPAADVTATLNGTTLTIAAEATAATGLVATPVTVRVSDITGDYVDVTVTVTINAPPPPPSDCVLGSLSASPNPVARQGGGGGAKKLATQVTITLTYTGTCDGLRLNYDSGDPSGLGTGVGRVFPPGSPSSIVIVDHFQGGTEQFTPGDHVLTASTSSVVTPSSVTTTLTVT